MKTIATLTMNPTIDASYHVDHVVHTHKMRTRQEQYDPGGGGINVSRVIARFGGTARAYYVAGGATGIALDGLLDQHDLVRKRITIAGSTRICAALYAVEAAKEYRFVPAGPSVAAHEWQACLDALALVDCHYLVASGSLPPGVPPDFYSRVQQVVAARGVQLVLDTSGPALKEGLAGGGVLLAKPSIGELCALAGRPLENAAAAAAAAMEIVLRGQAEIVAVTLGHEGALLVRASGALRLPAVPVIASSAVGAGDSFLAAMMFALAQDWDVLAAFRYGMAAGAAAVLTPGTDLCHLQDVERLYKLSASIEAETV